jgi:hypothetical protein
VPHVRPSVHGPKKTGAALSTAPLTSARKCCQEQGCLHKWTESIGKIHFLGANVGHPTSAKDRGWEISRMPAAYLLSISRAIIRRWISLVPSPMVQSLTSR